MGLLSAIITYTTQNGSTKEWLDDVEGFFKTHSAAGTDRTIAQSIESIKGNIEYLGRNKESVTLWLKKNFA
jgi:hypothetical protein